MSTHRCYFELITPLSQNVPPWECELVCECGFRDTSRTLPALTRWEAWERTVCQREGLQDHFGFKYLHKSWSAPSEYDLAGAGHEGPCASRPKSGVRREYGEED